MRTFARKQNQPQKKLSSSFTRSNPAILQTNHHASRLLHLQRTIGNQAVQRIMQANAIQTKLTISQPGDIYEQEADRLSEQVMNMSTPQLQRTCASGGESPKCQTEQPGQHHERLHTKTMGSNDFGQTAVPPIVHEVLRSPGRPLDPAARVFMEPRFGHDFSKLRVHTDAKAAKSAQDIGAAAYTVGNDIVFGAGEFNPQNSDGLQLIAHELTHVIQQSKGSHNLQQQPKKGRIIRVERTSRFRRRPPGPGAYTQEELNAWYERHPNAKGAGGASLVDGERTKDKAYTPEELWRNGYYYAKTTVSEGQQQAWESWLNDEGDGTVITIFVRVDK